MFRPREAGRCVKTITVLTPEKIKEEMLDSLKQGWEELLPGELITNDEFPEPELIYTSNLDTVLQVMSVIRKSGIEYQ